MEHDGGKAMRWASNDVEFLWLNATPESRYLRLELERGPGLGVEKAMLEVSLNGLQVDSLDLRGLHTIKVRLSDTGLKENIITLHVDREGKPVGPDPRILNFRVFSAVLSKK